jgi:ankyrin repeat protein
MILDSINMRGEAPLWLAAAEGHHAVVDALLSADSTWVGKRDNKGATPFWIAACNGHTKVVKALANFASDTYIVDVNRRDKSGMTTLDITVLKGHESTLLCLLENPQVWIDPLVLNPLLWKAAREGHAEVVGVLAGLNMAIVNYINLKDAFKRTPLLIALYSRHSATVRAILRGGRVDPSIPDATDNLAVNVAAAFGFKDIVVLLERATTRFVKRGARRDGVTWLVSRGFLRAWI